MAGYEDIRGAVRSEMLDILGAFHARPGDGLPGDVRTVLLLGPHEPGFWPAFSSSPEATDGAPDPLDRWSRRVIGKLAERLGARAVFPFDGPPFLPFITWARRSGRAWASPVGLLVHETAGLMVSYRGALALSEALELPAGAKNPCDTCPDQPCKTSCPAQALSEAGYDVGACHAHLDAPAGRACLEGGCLVRRACPVSQSYGRMPEQSAFHMTAFHP